MSDLCRCLLVNNILLSSLLLRCRTYLLIYLLSSHLLWCFLHNHATKIHILVIHHLKFYVERRNLGRSLVISIVLLSHLADRLRAAINLCLYCLDLKLPFIGILQLYSFAHWSWRKWSLTLTFAWLITGCIVSWTEINFVNLTLLSILLSKSLSSDPDCWGGNFNFRNLSRISFDSLSKNRSFGHFEILFLFNLHWGCGINGELFFLVRHRLFMF